MRVCCESHRHRLSCSTPEPNRRCTIDSEAALFGLINRNSLNLEGSSRRHRHQYQKQFELGKELKALTPYQYQGRSPENPPACPETNNPERD